MYLAKTPGLVKPLFKDLVWEVPTTESIIYLTFDDGPTPTVTEWVLEQLATHNAKATFFCIGDKVEKSPKLFDLLTQTGHRVGNHSYNHLKGWETDDATYFDNVAQCAGLIDSNLFRPPYGKASKSQIAHLKKKYSIVMWDVLSGDFDESITAEKCFSNVVDNVKPGSIVVFHDSDKAWPRLEYTLPKTLEALSEQGYRFEGLPEKL